MKKLLLLLSLTLSSVLSFAQNTSSLPYYPLLLKQTTISNNDSVLVFNHTTLKYQKMSWANLKSNQFDAYINRDGTSTPTTGDIKIGNDLGLGFGGNTNAYIRGSDFSGGRYVKAHVGEGLNYSDVTLTNNDIYLEANRRVGQPIVESGYMYLSPNFAAIGRDSGATKFSTIELSTKGVGIRSNTIGSAAGFVYLKSNAVGVGTNYTQQLQAANGIVALKSDIPAAVTPLTAASPLSYNSGTGVISISVANGSTNGYVSSTDWTTFNNKVTSVTGTTNRIISTGGTAPAIDISSAYVGQNSITLLGTIGSGTWQGTPVTDAYISSASNWNTAYTNRINSLTTTGSSGTPTLLSNVLNIPAYTLSGLGGQPSLVSGTNIKTLYGSTLLGTGDVGITPPTYGGTGVNNGTFTSTLSGNFATTGAFNPTFAIPRTTTFTLPNTANETLAGLGTNQTYTATNTFNIVQNIRSVNVLDVDGTTWRLALTNGSFASQLLIGSQFATIQIGNNGWNFTGTTLACINSGSPTLQGGNGGLNITANSNAAISSGPINIFTQNSNGVSPGATGSLINYSGNSTNVSGTGDSGSWLWDAGTVAGSGRRGNFQLFGGNTVITTFQGMQRGLYIGNVTVAPTGNPTNGFFHYSNAGVPTWRTTGGAVVSLGLVSTLVDVNMKHLIGGGSAPTIAAGAGAGTGPTVSVTGTDVGGYITLTTGTSPSVSATVATITFNTAYTSAPRVVQITPAGPNSAALAGTTQTYVDQSGITPTTFALTEGVGGLGAGLTYKWYYTVIQ